ncbi:uncharacterized protein si:ch211-214p13.8 isoform X1 [Poecilia reticulata]|uniref:uncharacterized protein si:ch211-214p13.8 isoform X1 n=1 Tax=Poecilia reticulata TaxID=8081 RepID=UPI0007EA555C|nr:PREDICTED: uncharacterized protein LOC103460006 isoform X1 [Poecilia reticulata]
MAEVLRGEAKRVSPGENLTVECPVKHCGESFSIIWFKFSNTLENWENISDTDNIRITQKDDKENLISYLSFEQVSINDDGLYRCALGHSNEFTSHHINISVSGIFFPRFTCEMLVFSPLCESYLFSFVAQELNNGVENPDDDSDSIGDDRSSLHFFLIGVTIVFPIAIAIVLILVCVQGWKQMWTCNNNNQEEKSTRMTSELPETSASSSPSLRTQFSVLNNIYSSSKPERTSTSLALSLTGNVADTAANSQASNYAVFTVINYQQCGAPARKYTCKQDETTNCCYQRLKR